MTDRHEDGQFADRHESGQFAEGNTVAQIYDEEEHVHLITSLAQLGATDREIADALKISTVTLYRWRNKYEAVCNALKIAKEPADNRVERSLYNRALGYAYTEQQAIKVRDADGSERIELVTVERFAPADTTANIFWLKNRRREQWRDKSETALTDADGKSLAPIINVTTTKG